MTPNLALTLTYEGISLLMRQANGTWRALGEVGFDATDLAGALANLRAIAKTEGGANFSTLLVLPEDQVLFTQVTVPSGTTVASAITAHLEGRTPYAVSDLVYDSVASGATHQIAAVARETLSEAEIFAEGHGFRPVGFTVKVPQGAYNGAPDFGDCAAAAKHLQGALRTPETRAVTVAEPVQAAPAQTSAPMFSSSRAAAKDPAPQPKPGADAAARLGKIPPRPKVQPAPKPAPLAPVMAAPKRARVGLWLTIVLLVTLVGVGVWSVIAPPQDAVTTTLPETPQGDTSALAPPADPFDLIPDAETTSQLAGGDFADLSLAPTPDELAHEPEPLPEFDAALVELPTARQVVDIYTTSGIWVGTPDAPEPLREDQLETLYQTTLDAIIAPADAVALPDAASLLETNLPRTHLPPPPAGTRFEVSEDGIVVPTPEGIITPDGVRVIAGPPDVQTRPRPEGLGAPESEPAPEVADAAQSTQDAAALQDLIARMTAIPPTRKPTDLAERIERAQNDGRTFAELRTPAPRPRPVSVQEQVAEEDRLAASIAAAAAQAAQQASLAGTGAASGNTGANPGGIALAPQETAPPAAATSAVGQRLAGTPSPRARPRNIDVLVAAARERPQSTTSATPSSPSTATAQAPAVTRTLPTGSTVARAATQENALPRARVNLIGVFGKPSAPKALVRIRNGRTERVGVGDRVDGGTVTSIGQGRLTYRKGSRDLVLEMPRI